jgi:hypothetical protein
MPIASSADVNDGKGLPLPTESSNVNVFKTSLVKIEAMMKSHPYRTSHDLAISTSFPATSVSSAPSHMRSGMI